MAFVSKFEFAPAEWLPLQDREMLDRVCQMDFNNELDRQYENPEFQVKVVYDVHNYFTTDLFHRIRMSDINDQKLLLSCPLPKMQYSSVWRK